MLNVTTTWLLLFITQCRAITCWKNKSHTYNYSSYPRTAFRDFLTVFSDFLCSSVFCCSLFAKSSESVQCAMLKACDNNNNNNIADNVYGAVIMTQSLREFTRFIWWMQTECRVAANPQTKPTNLGCESAESWLLPSQTPLPFIIITQLVS